MARGLTVGDGPLWAAAGALIAGIFTLLAQKLRGKTDETVAVLGQWQELLNAHKASAAQEIALLKGRVGMLEKELAEVRDTASKGMAELRKAHATELDEVRTKHRTEMKSLRELNEGLQRMIAQNSQSTAQLISEDPTKASLKKA